MVEIEMRYLKLSCVYNIGHAGFDCLSNCKEHDCEGYSSIRKSKGECDDIIKHRCYKGVNVKKYDIIPWFWDNTYPAIPLYMIVKVGGREYICDWIKLNGEIIFDNIDKKKEYKNV